MRYTHSAITWLNRQYKDVLLKCFYLNMAALMVALPAHAGFIEDVETMAPGSTLNIDEYETEDDGAVHVLKGTTETPYYQLSPGDTSVSQFEGYPVIKKTIGGGASGTYTITGTGRDDSRLDGGYNIEEETYSGYSRLSVVSGQDVTLKDLTIQNFAASYVPSERKEGDERTDILKSGAPAAYDREPVMVGTSYRVYKNGGDSDDKIVVIQTFPTDGHLRYYLPSVIQAGEKIPENAYEWTGTGLKSVPAGETPVARTIFTRSEGSGVNSIITNSGTLNLENVRIANNESSWGTTGSYSQDVRNTGTVNVEDDVIVGILRNARNNFLNGENIAIYSLRNGSVPKADSGTIFQVSTISGDVRAENVTNPSGFNSGLLKVENGGKLTARSINQNKVTIAEGGTVVLQRMIKDPSSGSHTALNTGNTEGYSKRVSVGVQGDPSRTETVQLDIENKGDLKIYANYADTDINATIYGTGTTQIEGKGKDEGAYATTADFYDGATPISSGSSTARTITVGSSAKLLQDVNMTKGNASRVTLSASGNSIRSKVNAGEGTFVKLTGGILQTLETDTDVHAELESQQEGIATLKAGTYAPKITGDGLTQIAGQVVNESATIETDVSVLKTSTTGRTETTETESSEEDIGDRTYKRTVTTQTNTATTTTSPKSLVTDLDNLTATTASSAKTITNNGYLVATGGTIRHLAEGGTGTVVVAGEVGEDQTVDQNIIIAGEDEEVTWNDTVTTTVKTTVTTKTAVYEDDAEVESYEEVETTETTTESTGTKRTITGLSAGTLTADLSDLTGNITNNGTLNVTGDLTRGVDAGTGRTVLQNTVTAVAEDVTIAGTLDLNGKTVNMQDSDLSSANPPYVYDDTVDPSYQTVTVDHLAGDGNMKIDVDMTPNSGKATGADKIVIANGASNDAEVVLTSVNVKNPDALTEGTYNDYVTFIGKTGTGTLTGINTYVGGKTDGSSIAVPSAITYTDSGLRYTFTAGSTGKANVTVASSTVTLPEFIQRNFGTEPVTDTYSINNDITLDEGIGTTYREGTESKELSVFVNNGSVITANASDSAGFTVASDYTLNLQGEDESDGTMTGFDTALTVNEGGSANVANMIFTDNTKDIENAGDLALADVTADTVENESDLSLSGTNEIASITGQGKTTVTGGTSTVAELEQKTVEVGSGATLSTDISKLSVTDDIANAGTLRLTGTGTLNNMVDGGTVQIAEGKVSTNADNITGDVEVETTGTYDITGGTIANSVSDGSTEISGNNVAIVDTADLSGTNTTITGSLDVGTSNATLGNTTINGTVKMELTQIAADSDQYEGGHLNVQDLTFGDSSKLSLTVAQGLLQNKESTAGLDLITASGTDSRTTTGKDFAEMFEKNNRYDVTAQEDGSGNKTGKYVISMSSSPSDIVDEYGGNRNNRHTAEGWDKVRATGGTVATVAEELNELSQHDGRGYVNALTALAPTDTIIHVAMTQDTNNAISDQVNERLKAKQGRSGGDRTIDRNSAWGQVAYRHARQDSAHEHAGFSADTYAATFGMDGKMDQNTLIGLGYSTGDINANSKGRRFDANTHTLFAYGKYQPDNWYVRGMVDYGYAEYKERVKVASVQNTASYNIQNFGARAYVGYDYDNGVTPEVGLEATHIKRQNYTDDIGQHVNQHSVNLVTAKADVQYAKTYNKGCYLFKPKAHVGVSYDLISDNAYATVRVGGIPYQIWAHRLNRFGTTAGVGADIVFDNWTFTATYDAGLRSNYLEQSGWLKAKYSF